MTHDFKVNLWDAINEWANGNTEQKMTAVVKVERLIESQERASLCAECHGINRIATAITPNHCVRCGRFLHDRASALSGDHIGCLCQDARESLKGREGQP